ncbi:MAG: Bug family tripartite tricarboxylate transporter substrate binding protein [Candidatus Binatia bacterium]
MKTKRSLLPFLVATLLIVAVLSLTSAGAVAQTSFFKGKTIAIIQGRDPGGTGDLRVRALVPFLQKYIPGNPTIVMEFMPGGGSRKAANHVFRSARPDGLTIGNLSAGMVSLAVLGESGVLYDIDKFSYLGSAYSTYHSVFVSRKDAGFDTIEKLRAATGVKVGAQSLGFSTYNEGRLFGYILGLKDPLFIAAFGGAELDPALMRGEIDARATGPDTILSRNREWLEKGLANIHAIMETPKGDKHPHPFFAKLPELETFAKNDLERKVIALQRAFRVTGSPFVLPPGTPKDRVVILQEAFRKTYRDPDFFKEYKKLTADDPSPLLPENHEKAIKDIPRDPEVIELFKILAGPKKLPPR